MGVIRRNDTRLWVAFYPSVADALNDDDCWLVAWAGLRLPPQNREVAVNLKYPIEHGIVSNWDDTERNLASHFFPCDCLAGPR